MKRTRPCNTSVEIATESDLWALFRPVDEGQAEEPVRHRQTAMAVRQTLLQYPQLLSVVLAAMLTWCALVLAGF